MEENNFGIRKRLLEYDDVMNSQREVVYKQRRHALYGERLKVDIANMMYDVCESIVEEHHGISEFEDFKLDLIRWLSVESPISEAEYLKFSVQDIVERIYDKALQTYKQKTALIAEQSYPIIKEVYEKQGQQYENILVPITDGNKVYNVLVNLKSAYETEGREVIKAFEKTSILATIDESWKEHLREMDDLKQSVQNATYEQKDPLLIYKLESFDLFKNMVDKNNRAVVSILVKAQLPVEKPSDVKQARERKRLDMSKFREGRSEGESGKGKKEEKLQPVRVEKKINRNAPCPCGSGKKYKQCHGR